MSRKIAGLVLLAPILAAGVDFQKEVRPILSNNCFACHGPDKESRMANLRLDRQEDARAALGKVMERITAEKPARRMPPPYSHKTLTSQQIETLKRWIAEGAPWKEQWAFIAPVRPAVPAVKSAEWVRNPIDAFILAKLETAGLKPAPEADKRKLARRVALDLIGLPPTPAEVDAFVRDSSADSYEKLIDHFMASPHYGEHRARYWLDAARYADTHGIHVDNYREMWPYRDWVIQAFNKNMPFDRFTIEQLAGDLLPNRTLDQQIASGFNRCNVTTNEAGIIAEEFEAIYSKDRADTTGAVWLGLTVGCATCHDHKFDPISQRDHYTLEAFFRNTTQPVMDGNVSDTPPIVVVPRASDRKRWFAVQQEQAAVRARMKEMMSSPGKIKFTNPPRPLDEGSEIFARTDEATFEGKKTIDLPNQPVFGVSKQFSMAMWMKMPKSEESLVAASQFDPDALNQEKEKKGRGWIFDIGGRVPGFRVTGDDGSSLDARAGHLDQLLPGTWHHVVVTYDGTGERMGLSMFLDGRAIDIQGSEPLTKLKGNFATKAPLRLGGDTKRFFEGGTIKDFRIFSRVLSEDEARLVWMWPKLHEGDADAVRLFALRHADAGYQKLTKELAELESERKDMRRRAAVSHVMEERADQKPFAHVLFRGMYDQPREKVEPDVPSALPPMPKAYPRDRLGLAEWLMNADNPLTSRVTVNRYWQELFGTGIVKTAEDFGSQGEPPSHPELLDWLAVDFRESGWDVKRLIKTIMLSSTYRQAALTTEDKLKVDPENRLLSRGPRFRMDGELVRDYALAASGLLNEEIGGPSVKPYQPDGVWETVAMLGSNTRFYKHDSGEKLYRRSMYTFWKRSAPPASMDIFNAPTREACTVRRERTNTPLQALVTMNDVQFVEAARILAERALAVHGVDGQVDLVSGVLLARPLEDRERTIVKRELKDFLSYYDSHPADAKKLIAMGERKPAAKLAPAELAAMTMVVNQMMNLDEVLNK